MIYIGTSGFKFADWKGAFYPPEVKPADWLAYYARHFNCLEINASYYRLLGAKVTAQMAAKVPADFLFTIKAYRTLTHEIKSQTPEDWAIFADSLQPLIAERKFGCVLAQFPTSFRPTPQNLGYLGELRKRLEAYPLVVEFRRRDWLTEATFSWLKAHDIGFCGVDEPQLSNLMPPVAHTTSAMGYVRFHGRNAKDWWSGNREQRYDYLYSEAELQEWVPKIHTLDQATEKTFVFLNNCHAGKAVKNALYLKAVFED
jgi:uncharacterized protein YecE (DUF72 family)